MPEGHTLMHAEGQWHSDGFLAYSSPPQGPCLREATLLDRRTSTSDPGPSGIDLDIGLFVQRNSIVQSGTVLIFAIHCGLYLHSWLNIGVRNQKPFTTFSLFFKKKKILLKFKK